MNLCLVLSKDDDLSEVPSEVLAHSFSALVGDDALDVLTTFNSQTKTNKVTTLKALIHQHCVLTSEEFVIVDLPEDVPTVFLTDLTTPKGAPKKKKRSDTPNAGGEGDHRTIEVKSGTDPNVVYNVIVDTNTNKAVSCNCMGFKYYKDCKHLGKAQNEIDMPY